MDLKEFPVRFGRPWDGFGVQKFYECKIHGVLTSEQTHIPPRTDSRKDVVYAPEWRSCNFCRGNGPELRNWFVKETEKWI